MARHSLHLAALRFFLAVSTVGLALPIGSAHAAETCIVCAEPAATYLCQAKAAPEHNGFLANDRLIQFACLKNISKTYGHGSCKASKTAGQTCAASNVVQLDLTAMARNYVNRVPPVLRSQQPAQPPQPTTRAKPAEPKTVVELAKRTAESSQRQLENAGDAVKNAGKVVTDGAKKTWQCLTTFFQRCN